MFLVGFQLFGLFVVARPWKLFALFCYGCEEEGDWEVDIGRSVEDGVEELSFVGEVYGSERGRGRG